VTVSSTDVSSERPTVLVADDEAALTDSIAVWLSEYYQVRTAYSGTEALSAYDPSVDVVLLDRRMPGLSGEDVLEELHEQRGEPSVAILTATDVEDASDDFESLPFDKYLKKPVSKSELLDAVRCLSSSGSAPMSPDS
jgi:DNA-binding response OmpR family regulator